MGRIVHDQVIAGTNLDRSGARIEPEVLKNLFEQLSVTTPAGIDHDLARPAIARLLSKRLLEGASGELLIVADIEVFDEETFARMGGFSISFTRETVRIGSGQQPDVRVLVNPAQFDFQQVVEDVRTIIPPGATVDVAELIQKAEILTTAVVTVIVYGFVQTAAGFFNAAGAALFEKLRDLRRRDAPNQSHQLQIHAIVLAPSHGVVVTVVLSLSDIVTPEAIARLNIENLSTVVDALAIIPQVNRLLGSVTPEGDIELHTACLHSGETIELK